MQKKKKKKKLLTQSLDVCFMYLFENIYYGGEVTKW